MDTRMDRRAFLKNAALAGAALMVAPVALGAVEPKKALADGGTCTANVSCDPDNALIDALIGSDTRGYMTNANTPLHGGFPTSPVSGNATYEMDGENYVITIPLVNTMFRLLDIAAADDSGTIQIAKGDYDTSSSPNRLTSITVTSPVSSGSFTVTDVQEYAGYALIKDYANWPVLIEFSI